MRTTAAPAIGLLLLAFGFPGCRSHPPLPELGFVPQFSLIDQRGQPFSSSHLRGRVWLADFIYTNCPGPCPLMSQKMRRVQNASSAITLVSFSVDPARDTPEVLTAYSRRFDANPKQWTFLTGDSQTINSLNRDAFKLGFADGVLNHSTRFILVDQKGRIRAYYSMSDTDMVTRVVNDARSLAKETL